MAKRRFKGIAIVAVMESFISTWLCHRATTTSNSNVSNGKYCVMMTTDDTENTEKKELSKEHADRDDGEQER